ncbi:MAG TPA: protein TolR [Acidiferrobacterales bacterium]|nr:protein TolR [Acidiferrobacterales bacterium]
MPSVRHRRKPMAEINVVPYIDVMLVLLVIFMVTAPLLTPGVKVDLPQAAASAVDDPDRETLVVTVDRKGKLFLDDREIGAMALQSKVAAILRVRPQTPVLIRGDRQVAYNDVVQTMVLLQAAGAPSVGLVTQSPASRPAGKR